MHSTTTPVGTVGIETAEGMARVQQARAEHRKAIARSIDRALAKTNGSAYVDDEDPLRQPGCWGNFGSFMLRGFTRARHGSKVKGAVVVSTRAPAPSAIAASSEIDISLQAPQSMPARQGWGQRFFGRQTGATSDTSVHLARAAASLSQHVEDLEKRAARHKTQAGLLMKSGNKKAALAQLKRSKQLEAMAESRSKTIVAVERQADMLEEAGLQTQVANALQASVRDNKKLHKAMKNVEAVTDDASDLADTVAEVNDTLAQLGSIGYNDIEEDDEELL